MQILALTVFVASIVVVGSMIIVAPVVAHYRAP
jgi:hypothetical protein